jgi:hypothetical protein
VQAADTRQAPGFHDASTLALARRRVPHPINFPQLCDES